MAARLAQAGYSVLLIDAGEDHGTDPIIEIPLFQASASEYTPITWQFFVSHYNNNTMAMRDSKFTWRKPDGTFFVGPNPPAGSEPLGIFYPRASTLGGCAEHNAVVATYPDESDWNYISSITGDSSWSADNMRQYWVKLENNQYLPPHEPGHGYNGWLDTTLTDINLIARDPTVLSLIQGAGSASGRKILQNQLSVKGLSKALIEDMNEDSPWRDTRTGLNRVPLSVSAGSRARSSHRLMVLNTAASVDRNGNKKYKLHLQFDTLVTRVIFDRSGSQPLAVGVQYLTGKHLYRADPNSGNSTVTGAGSFFAKKEVILAGGVFNTPQLLKLSGIGPKSELASHNISLVLNSPAVGTNMQDRYEVSVTGFTNANLELFKNCTFLSTPDDPCYARWQNNATDRGIYGTNGVAFGVVQKTSVSASTAADVFIAGVPTNFHGYFPGYSVAAGADIRHWSWLVLKAHNRNNAGTVTLKSADPRDVPSIAFNSFATGGDKDLQAAYEGVVLARKIFQSMDSSGPTFTEEVPGPTVQGEAALKQWIRDEAWGHHASCTVPIGAAHDSKAVLDSKFRVKGVAGLRVVDASIFPKIPGFYIAGAVYMISEKAAATIISGH